MSMILKNCEAANTEGGNRRWKLTVKQTKSSNGGSNMQTRDGCRLRQQGTEAEAYQQ